MSMRISGSGPTRRPDGSPAPADPIGKKPVAKSRAGLAGLSGDRVETAPRSGMIGALRPGPASPGALEATARRSLDAARALGAFHQEAAGKIDRIAGLVESGSPEDLEVARSELHELNRSFSLQYLELQKQMQAESRDFTMLGNVMKTRHEGAKNAIDEVR